jgi:hypothetical protein
VEDCGRLWKTGVRQQQDSRRAEGDPIRRPVAGD